MSWLTKLRHAMPGSLDDHTWRAALARQLDAIEGELRRIGWWQPGPLPPEKLQFTQAFGADTMAFAEWLQFVFVPNAREAVAGKRPLPRRSMVGAQAVREFDGVEEAEHLCALLSSFDVAIEGRKLPP